MEFLNDFLEQEATRMKEFLHEISTRVENPAPETILDWAGYIDQGKQLSILHNLLAESISKLPVIRQQDMRDLSNILDQITLAKESNSYLQQQSNQQQENLSQNVIRTAERGVIRGVLTPSSLEKNIFRYNDPTVSQHFPHHSQNSLNHSHSTSSISSTTAVPTIISHHRATPEKTHKSNVFIDPNHSRGGYSTTSHYYNTTSSNGGRKSPVINGGIRASTLPRNNNQNGSQMISTIEIHNNNNNGVEEINSNLIQIGLDPSNAFLRKSPTPLHKSISNGNGSKNRNINGSQLSLLSDRSNNKNNIGLNLHLGIPHNDVGLNANSNMPINLEDLDDLLKYADEQNEERNKPKDKGSNISIGQLSNVCSSSSGYQSIATQSQSSSPIELGQQTTDFINKNSRRTPITTNGVSGGVGKYQYLNNNKYSNNIVSIQPPLAFKNPLYHMQIDKSVTPSSSEERLSGDNHFYGLSSSNGGGEFGGEKDLNNGFGRYDSSKRLGSGHLVPRTNPLMQVCFFFV